MSNLLQVLKSGQKSNIPKDDYSKVFKLLIFTAGPTLALSYLLGNKLPAKLNKNKTDKIIKFKKALLDSHSPEQGELWNDISKTRDSVQSSMGIGTWKSLTTNIGGEISRDNTLDHILRGRSTTNIKKLQKWLQIQLTKYESSLDSNQMTLYKTIFELEMDSLRVTGLWKSLAYYGIPLLATKFFFSQASPYLEKWNKIVEEQLKSN